jgi:membrane-bound lytic murein transglycosylase D
VASCAALRRKPWSLFHPAWRSGGAASPQWPGTGLPLVDVPALVDDPDGRIEREFRVPAYLRDRVLFWMRIHAVYSLQMRVIHDRNDLALIYGYIDFRPWLEACGPQSRTRAAEKAIVAELKQRLRAAAVTRPHRPTAPEQAALSEFLADHGVTRATDLAVLPRRVRTQTGQRDEFQAGLERAKSLLPQIEVLFAQNGLPRTLARIPFVESSFNPRAHSRAGAFGIWQFMPHTARQYINKRDHTRWVDPLQQTVSAIGFLERTRVRLPDWSTTITAYNSGVGRMRRLVRKYGVRNIGGLLAQPSRASLGFAGKNFYAQVLSANLVEAYQEELFRGRLEPADYVAVLHHTNPPQRTARLPGPTTPRMSAGHTLPE